MTTRSSNPKKSPKQSAKKATKPADAIRALMDEIRDEDPRRMSALLAKLRTAVAEGGAAIVKVAQELGVLCFAARFGDPELVDSLLAAGVDPNVGAVEGKGHGRLALEAVFSSGAKPNVIERIVEALLAHGASVDLPSKQTATRMSTALEAADQRDTTRWLKRLAPLASERTRGSVLVGLLGGAVDLKDAEAAIKILRPMTPSTIDVGDGLTPLHAAAIGGHAKLVRAMVVPELPRLSATIWFYAGFSIGKVRIDRGATPLGAALATRDAAVAKREVARGDALAADIARLEEVIALFERAGARDGREQGAALQASARSPFERVVAAFTALAAALGDAQFAKLAGNIDPAGKGPINAMNACRQLLQKNLDASTKERLDRTLFGKCVTGAIDALPLEIVGEREELEEDEPELASARSGPTHLVDLDRYPRKLRALLKPQPPNVGYLGAHDDTVVLAEKRTTGTVVYEVTPERVVEHDAVVWIESGASMLVEGMRPGE